MARSGKQSGKAAKTVESFDDYIGNLKAGRIEGVADHQLGSAHIERIRKFLIDRYEGASSLRFQVCGDQIYDLIRDDNKPTDRRRSRRAAVPPPCLNVKDRGPKFDEAMPHLDGYVPMRRFTVADLAAPGVFDLFNQKYGAKPHSRLRMPGAEAPGYDDEGHDYASVFQNIPNTGACATLAIWQPPIDGGQRFSCSQLWVQGEGPKGFQTVEVGWHIYPELTKHNKPAMFVYWTADGYTSGHQHFNHDRNGEFQWQDGVARILSLPISDVSTFGGDQKEVFVAVRFYEGNWLVYIDGDQPENVIGFYPGSLFEGGALATGKADCVEFGGEVCGGPPFAPMGSGKLASAGYGQAAYQRQLAIYDPDGNTVESLDLRPQRSVPNEYTTEFGTSPLVNGSLLYFGGPGGR